MRTLTQEQKKIVAEQARAELAKRSLKEFVRQSWHVLEPSTPYIHGWHLDAISEHLEAVTRGEIRNLLINMPPRHMKSIQVSVMWPCWVWLNNPQKRWLFSSYAAVLSTRDSVKCRRLIESPWYQRNFGDIYQLTSDQNVKNRYENTVTGYRIATSVGGAATGEGGDIIVVDDPHNVVEATSKRMREATLEWWDETMSTRLNDPKTGAKVIVMQRVHEEDLSAHVLEQGGYEHLCLPAEYEGTKVFTSIGWTDPRKGIGELLWPERFGREEIDTLKRTLGTYGAAGQLQQRPQPLEGGAFKATWLKWFTKKQIFYNHEDETWYFLGEPLRIFQGVDPAISEKEEADDFADVTIGITPSQKIPFLDVFHDHLPFTEQPRLIIKKYQEWLPERVGIETNAYQQSLKQQTVKDAMILVKGLHHATDKYTRLMGMTPYAENGQFYLRMALDDEPGFYDDRRLPGIKIHESMRKLYHQMVTYGPNAAYEDVLDAAENAVSLAKPKLIPNEFYQ